MTCSNNQTYTTPIEVLKKVYGYTEFRDGQKEIIDNVLRKNDCLAILPTGGGKSICFQIPGLLFPGITIVVSPLISLMKDQVDSLKIRGISACYINSSLPIQKILLIYKLVKLNKFKFIYIAPERLENKEFQRLISLIKISLIVIDEAHCISQWGKDFRKSYQEIPKIYKYLSDDCKKIAVTATATKEIQHDIISSLKLQNPFIFFQSFRRTNLFISHINCFDQAIKNLVLIRLLKQYSQKTGIIYCSTRNACEQLSEMLNKIGFDTIFYHGGLNKDEKNVIQTQFISGNKKIIIATNAFGMGIDKSNIRFVIHYQIPNSIEGYYQEIGRAGRDGLNSFCYLLYCKDDEKIQFGLSKENKNKIKEFLLMRKLAITSSCKNKFILSYFGEKSQICNNCNSCEKTGKQTKQLLLFAKTNEIIRIKKLENLKYSYSKNRKKISKIYPITNTIIAFIALLEPKNKKEMLQIPGIGNGFIFEWYTPIKQILT